MEGSGRGRENCRKTNNLNPFIRCIIKVSTALGPPPKDQVNVGNVSVIWKCEDEIDRPWVRQ